MMSKYTIRLLAVLAAAVICRSAEARPSEFAEPSLPLIGGQIFIEPGQTAGEVETWFRSMRDNGMKVCRIRMFEQYMKSGSGEWDFSLFDRAFDMADKYGIKVFATLFPLGESGNMLGGFKHPQSEDHLRKIEEYTARVVQHYMNHPALYGWVLLNEPGSGGWVPGDSFTRSRYEQWLSERPASGYDSKGYNVCNFDRERFLVDYNTWYLQFLADCIARYDSSSFIHVNSHQIFDNVAEYDFPSWRKFLTSLGGSAHPSWHFGYFGREGYAAALSANCRIIRSGAGDMPFWVTELQGGNNTYSGNTPFCPTAEEITQWLWTSIGTGAKGVIFWCYNPRSVGEEAGEWALLTYGNRNSDRLDAVAGVTKCLSENESVFAGAVPVDSHISVIYLREALWAEKHMQINAPKDPKYEARQRGAAMKSAIGVYEALLAAGINANMGEISEYDWNRESYDGETVILAHQISLPSCQWENIRRFVARGGKLIVEGLTAFFDENMLSLHNTGFPLADVFGGHIEEIKTSVEDFEADAGVKLPAHLWRGLISDITGEPVGAQCLTGATAVRNRYGRGEVFWLATPVALGARRSHNLLPLSQLLERECAASADILPVRFAHPVEGVVMVPMLSPKGLVTVCINKSDRTANVEMKMSAKRRPNVLFADKSGTVHGNSLTIAPEETMVILWK